MPRASLNPKDAVASKSFGITEGNVEIIDAKVKVHQYPPNKDTGKQSAPFLCVQETYQLLDKDWNPIPDAEPVVVEFGLGKAAFNKFRPGNAQSEDDDNPEDMGKEVDAEGNTLYTDDPNAALNDKCKWVRHSNSLMTCGFRPDKISFIPNLIGLKGHIRTEASKFTAEDGAEGNMSVNLFDKIVHFPYEKPAAKGKPAPAGKNAPAKGKAAPAAPAADEASDILTELLGEPKYKLTGEFEFTKFYMGVQKAAMLAKKTRDQIQAVMALVKDNDALSAYGEETSKLIVDAEAGTVTVV